MTSERQSDTTYCDQKNLMQSFTVSEVTCDCFSVPGLNLNNVGSLKFLWLTWSEMLHVCSKYTSV